MKILLICLLATVANAAVTTNVNVPTDVLDASAMNTAVLPCEYEMLPDEEQPPIIYWMKGISVDDADAVVIFKGFRYWNESMGEYRQFFNGYQTRAAVEDLQSPALTLSGLTDADEGRYWCMVAEWSGRQQGGTDADSIALLRNTDNAFVDVETENTRSVDEGNTVALTCTSKGAIDMVTWYEGPFHLADSQNFTHTEIGSYLTLGTYDLTNDEVLMNPDYPTMTIDSKKTLTITNADIANAGRYWCEVTNTAASNIELETGRTSTLLKVAIEPFVCPEGATGLFPDPVDCAMYYECVEGDDRTYHRECGYDGLVYDEVNGYCDWAANVAPPCGTNSN